jgi:hypothetical protein
MMLLLGFMFKKRLVLAFVANIFLVTIMSGYLAEILVFGFSRITR